MTTFDFIRDARKCFLNMSTSPDCRAVRDLDARLAAVEESARNDKRTLADAEDRINALEAKVRDQERRAEQAETLVKDLRKALAEATPPPGPCGASTVSVLFCDRVMVESFSGPDKPWSMRTCNLPKGHSGAHLDALGKWAGETAGGVARDRFQLRVWRESDGPFVPWLHTVAPTGYRLAAVEFHAAGRENMRYCLFEAERA